MKIGIIIPCYNQANAVNIPNFLAFINTHADFHICFVNNGSTDNTFEILESLKNQASNKISVVDIKKKTVLSAVVKVGARYLYSLEGIEKIGFIEVDFAKDYSSFLEQVNLFVNQKKWLVSYNNRGNGKGDQWRNNFKNLKSKYKPLGAVISLFIINQLKNYFL